MCMIACVCVFSGQSLCPLGVKDGRATHPSQDNMRLCWGQFLQWTHVDSCGYKPDIFTIYVQHDNMMNVECTDQPACIVTTRVTHTVNTTLAGFMCWQSGAEELS